MIRLAMALSTFSGKMEECECYTERGFDDKEREWSSKYISQMEPTVFYLLENYDDDIELVLLCSKETHSIISGMDKDSIEIFLERVNDRARFLGKKDVRVKTILLDKDKSIPGVRETARYIKENTVVNGNDKLWIDIHGGFRDISVTFNALISLLKVYGIRTDKVVTVQWSGGKTSLVKDVTDSFRMFDFVSGMNEFIQYGSADSLLGFDKEFIDKSILECIRDISDGTKLCDPYLYKKGLHNLGKRLSKVEKHGEYTGLFEQYIRDDYGELLDQPTNLGIIKRCYKKRMYQQALTFIESLMPESIVENKVIFFNNNEMGIIKKIQDTQEQYRSSVYSMSSFLINNYINNKIEDYLNYSECCGSDSENLRVIEAIKKPELLKGDFFSDGEYIEIEKHYKRIGKVYIYTDLKKDFYDDAGGFLRLHKALKKCRNMTNHAQEGKSERPEIKDIDNAISYYIELADRVFDPNNREIVKHNYMNSLLYDNQESKKGKSKNYTNKDQKSSRGFNIIEEALKKVDIALSGTDEVADLLEINSVHKMTIDKIGKNVKKKLRLEGKLDNGGEAIIPGSSFTEGEDLEKHIGKEKEVVIVRIQDGKYICSLNEE